MHLFSRQHRLEHLLFTLGHIIGVEDVIIHVMAEVTSMCGGTWGLRREWSHVQNILGYCFALIEALLETPSAQVWLVAGVFGIDITLGILVAIPTYAQPRACGATWPKRRVGAGRSPTIIFRTCGSGRSAR